MTQQGTVRKMVRDKGYGFIKASEGEYFFHATGCEQPEYADLREGDEVTFEVTTTAKGPRAEEVNRVG